MLKKRLKLKIYSEAPNDGFLLNTLKHFFWLSRVLLDLYRDALYLFGHLRGTSASFPVVLGDFGCDVTCQAGHSDSANRPGYETGGT